MAQVEYVGRVVNPLRDRTRRRRPDRRRRRLAGRSPGYLSTEDIEDAGGIAAEGVDPLVASSRLDVAMGGFAPGFNETNDQTRKDLTKAELIAFPILALLLLFVFRGVVAASIPLLIGVISIVGTLLVLRIMSIFVDTSVFALNIATGLSLGLAVDYALLLVSRYREEIGGGGASREAHRRTVRTAGRTVVFSGLTVAAAMAALIVLPQRFLYSMAVAGASVAVLSALIAILVVPSLLALLGTRIDALSIRRGPAVSDTSDGWYRLARGVMRRPVAVALASSALLLACRDAAAVDDADRPQRRGGPARTALLRRLPVPRGALPARRHRGGHRHRRRAGGRRSSWPASAGASKRSTGSPAAPPSCAPPARSPTPTSPSRARRSTAPRRTPCARSGV